MIILLNTLQVDKYFTKKNQACEMISLSPLFYNNKYSVNKILQPLRFNLITNNWWQKKSILIIELNFKNNNLIDEESIKMISGTRGIKQNFQKIITELSNHLNKILAPELNNLELNLSAIDCKKYGTTLFLLLKLS